MRGVLFYNKCRIKTNVLTSIQLTEAKEKDVNFYDYDGFRLFSYTNAEALALTELPPGNLVINENLTFDEWNWTLADIKTQINNVGGVVNVGAIYHTTDDKTHITCKPTETFLQAYICLTPTASGAVTVDWGDGTTSTWTSASQENKSHTYTNVTESSVYDITISCTSGTYSFATYITGSSTNNPNCVYTDIRLSSDVTSLGYSCFQNCYSLQSITIPSSVTSLGGDCFNNCFSLQSITIPSRVTSLGTNCFYGCKSLQSVAIPSGVTSLGDNCFGSCVSLQSLTIPSSVTSLGGNCFIGCYSLKYVAIPDTITSLDDSCFQYCCSLQSINIPSNATSLGSNCFQNCSSLKKIYSKPTTPPTLSNTNAIPNNTNLVIYVPTGNLSTYQNAENWSTYSSKMVEYNF